MASDERDAVAALAAPIAEQRLRRNLQGVRARQERRRLRMAQLRASALTALSFAAALGLFLALRAPAAGVPRAPVALGDPRAPARLGEHPKSERAESVALRDGSRVHLGRGARLALAESDERHQRSVLHAGWARFDVVPGLARVFEVQAGPVEVVVVGTSFTVARDGERARVAVHHGRVRVKSALVPEGEITLGAGEHVEVQGVPAEPPSVSPEARLAAESPAREAAPRAAALSVRAAMERADELRVQKRWRLAAAVLRAAHAAHASDPDAGLLLITLAQLELDTLESPAAAATHYARAVSLGTLPTTLHEEAMARAVVAWLAAGDRPRAEQAARAYAQSFPQGGFREVVRAALATGAPETP